MLCLFVFAAECGLFILLHSYTNDYYLLIAFLCGAVRHFDTLNLVINDKKSSHILTYEHYPHINYALLNVLIETRVIRFKVNISYTFSTTQNRKPFAYASANFPLHSQSTFSRWENDLRPYSVHESFVYIYSTSKLDF